MIDGTGRATPEVQSRLDELLAQTSRTFALTIPLLGEPTRTEVTVAYLLFRVADTLEDATRWDGVRKRVELARLGELLRGPHLAAAERLAATWRIDPPCDHRGYVELLADLPRVIESLAALAPPARTAIARHLGRTVEQMASFAAREGPRGLQLDDLADLRRYCYAVAGIVGEMLTELFLLDRPGLGQVAEELRGDAASFGEALQLVNILKDSSADQREGRAYLPADVARSAVFELAREDLERAGRYCRTLERAAAPRELLEFTTLPVLLARATLDRVERDGPGSKLTRAEVAALVGEMKDALDQRRFAALWRGARGA